MIKKLELREVQDALEKLRRDNEKLRRALAVAVLDIAELDKTKADA